jgi:hypothetical protein
METSRDLVCLWVEVEDKINIKQGDYIMILYCDGNQPPSLQGSPSSLPFCAASAPFLDV